MTCPHMICAEGGSTARQGRQQGCYLPLVRAISAIRIAADIHWSNPSGAHLKSPSEELIGQVHRNQTGRKSEIAPQSSMGWGWGKAVQSRIGGTEGFILSTTLSKCAIP